MVGQPGHLTVQTAVCTVRCPMFVHWDVPMYRTSCTNRKVPVLLGITPPQEHRSIQLQSQNILPCNLPLSLSSSSPSPSQSSQIFKFLQIRLLGFLRLTRSPLNPIIGFCDYPGTQNKLSQNQICHRIR